MNDVYLGIITLSIVASTCAFVYILIEVRNATKAIKDFLKTTEDTLNPTLEELRKSLKSMRNVTDNTTAIIEDVRNFSASVRGVGDDIKRVSNLVNSATTSSFICLSGLNAGIKAAASVFLRNLRYKRQKPNQEEE